MKGEKERKVYVELPTGMLIDDESTYSTHSSLFLHMFFANHYDFGHFEETVIHRN